MNLVFVSSPYRGDIEANVAYAKECVRHSFDQGEAPFAPHLLYPQVLDDTDPIQRQRAMQAGHEWLEKATLAAFYVDHGWSAGMLTELKVARVFRVPIQVRTIKGVISDAYFRRQSAE